MTVVVLDTNSIGRGNFIPREIDRLAAISDRFPIEFVVPEVVLWEWTEHAHAKYSSWTKEATALSWLHGSSVEFEELDVTAVYDRIEKELPDCFRVVPNRKLDTEAAVRSQILMQGVASRKNGTKTGAADELVLQVVELERVPPHRPLVLWSSDKAVRRECKRRRPDVELIRGAKEIPDHLRDFHKANKKVAAALQLKLDELTPESFDYAELGIDTAQADRPDIWHAMVSLESIEFESLSAAALKVSTRDDGDGVAIFTLAIEGVARIHEYTLEQTGPDDFGYELHDRFRARSRVEVPCMADFDSNLCFAEPRVVGVARAATVPSTIEI